MYNKFKCYVIISEYNKYIIETFKNKKVNVMTKKIPLTIAIKTYTLVKKLMWNVQDL